MRKPLIIGDKTFQFKKDAVSYYREILHSYSIGQSLNDKDFLEENIDEIEEYSPEIIQLRLDLDKKIDPKDIEIIDIKVDRFDYNNKRFMIVYNDLTTCYFSYLYAINRPKENPDTLFNYVCRDLVREDIYNVKKKFYNENAVNGLVKCQESNEWSKWEELVIDHRQPNTFSIIVERFKEIYRINSSEMQYKETKDGKLLFKDDTLNLAFKNYHKEKANLRIVRKELNGSRTNLAILKRSNKDLKIE